MKKLVHFALAALFLAGIASAQNAPAVDVFGGYSYLNFNLPSNSGSSTQKLAMNGWDFSASVGLFHRLAVEADFGGHYLSDCGGTQGLNCSNLSYMFGPRFTFWGSLQPDHGLRARPGGSRQCHSFVFRGRHNRYICGGCWRRWR